MKDPDVQPADELVVPEGYDPDEALKLSNQLCFPLYATSKELVRRYKPFLDELDLTYTQYITMMVLWERDQVSVKELGEAVRLDSGTLTPLLKKLEAHGLITRERSQQDERQLVVELTDAGRELKRRAGVVPLLIGPCVGLDAQEVVTLRALLDKVQSGLVCSWEY